ncbi:hypothetical protein F4782DRAFT_550979 [Xylaria castorea]|nr:hypothetical protein F4782DRAFT_550979 [Xylaria castorea]
MIFCEEPNKTFLRYLTVESHIPATCSLQRDHLSHKDSKHTASLLQSPTQPNTQPVRVSAVAMAEQGRDNPVKEELTSEQEDQVEVELTSSDKGKSHKHNQVGKDGHVKDKKKKVMKERSFHKFLLLPAELRLIIWEYALPDERTIRICPNEDTDDEDDDEDDENEYGNPYQMEGRSKRKGIDQWGFPSCCYAPEILNPAKFLTFPLAGVCQESREFIIDFGYEILHRNLMTVSGGLCEGPWFCPGRDEIEEFSDELIVKLSTGGPTKGDRRRGDWIYE